MNKVNNPHDSLVRETLSRKETAADFLKNYLPERILSLVDMDTLEISKDSFIEEKLADYYSDILYKVKFKGETGFIYLLFEHKSAQDALLPFQLYGYVYHIYKLHIKQTKVRRLPVVIPMVLYHGRKKWKVSRRFSSIIQGPYEMLKEYVPDFRYILFDLTQYSDEEIKGEVHSRILLLLLKHISDPNLFDKLPDILSLLAEVARQDTGLQTIEALLRYLFSTVEDRNMDKVKNIVEKALTDEKGESVMATIAERLRNEGMQQGIWQGIEMDLDIRFGAHGLEFMEKIRNIQDIQKLKSVMKAVKVIKNIDELEEILN